MTGAKNEDDVFRAGSDVSRAGSEQGREMTGIRRDSDGRRISAVIMTEPPGVIEKEREREQEDEMKSQKSCDPPFSDMPLLSPRDIKWRERMK